MTDLLVFNGAARAFSLGKMAIDRPRRSGVSAVAGGATDFNFRHRTGGRTGGGGAQS